MSKFLKGYKVELDPNKCQMTLFRKHFGAARWAFNFALQKKKEAFDKKEKIQKRLPQKMAGVVSLRKNRAFSNSNFEIRMPIPLNIVEDADLLINKGDAMVVSSLKGGITQLIMCCPKCGKLSGSARNHSYNESTRTYTPSIVHNTELGGCGWHGYLTAGEFTGDGAPENQV